jgi:hypothetical protein
MHLKTTYWTVTPCLLLLVLLTSISASAEESILALHRDQRGQLVKAAANVKQYRAQLARGIEGQQIETLEYRGFTLHLNRYRGAYELQASRTVQYGDVRISSIFSSQYQASIDYIYTYDPKTKEIRQDHFIFPPNSLTGWANPENFMLLKHFDWREKYPASNCQVPVYTSEEYGREYLEASCFPTRDRALRFAKRFIDYARGRRSL